MEERITFYAAECDEFHVLGEFDEGLTLQEAVERFNQMPPERMNGIPCIGFRYEDGGSIYDGTECDIYCGGEVMWDEVNETEYYRNSPLVQATMKEVQAMAERGEIRGYKGREQEEEIAQGAVGKEKTQEPRVQESIQRDVEKKREAEPSRGQPVSPKKEEHKSSGKRESVLQALRQRQAKLKEQEKSKGKEQSQNHKKGDMAL